MKDLVDKFTWKSIHHDKDGATEEYYAKLKSEGKLYTTQCTSCEAISYPPRTFCPSCFNEETKWVDISSRKCTLYSFTTQNRALRFLDPDVLGIVEIEGVGRILSKINAKISELEIGQKLEMEAFEISGELTTHSFTPI